MLFPLLLTLTSFAAPILGEKLNGTFILPTTKVLASEKIKFPSPHVISRDFPFLTPTDTTVVNSYTSLGSGVCDISGIRSIAEMKPDLWWPVSQCHNVQTVTLGMQAVVFNPLRAKFSIYLYHVAYGGSCGYTSVVTHSGLGVLADDRVARHTALCPYNRICCAIVHCEHSVADCEGLKVSVAFVAPEPQAKINVTNYTLPYIPSGGVSRAADSHLPGRINKASTLRSLTISNPNGHELLVWMTDSSELEGCGLANLPTWIPGIGPYTYTYTYNERQLSTKSTSIALRDVPCESSRCCAIIYCTSANTFGCWGMSYSHRIRYRSFTDDALAGAERMLAVNLQEKAKVESDLTDAKAQAKKAQKSTEDTLAVALQEKAKAESDLTDAKAQAKKAQKSTEDKLAVALQEKTKAESDLTNAKAQAKKALKSVEDKLSVALQEKAGLQAELMEARAQGETMQSKLALTNDTASTLLLSVKAEAAVCEKALRASIPRTSVGLFSIATLKLAAGVLLIDAVFFPLGYWLIWQCKKQKAD